MQPPSNEQTESKTSNEKKGEETTSRKGLEKENKNKINPITERNEESNFNNFDFEKDVP
jgi:hypothetical protein